MSFTIPTPFSWAAASVVTASMKSVARSNALWKPNDWSV